MDLWCLICINDPKILPLHQRTIKQTLTRMPAVSIIVPAYNVGAYLEQCLDSIKAQTFTDWECIVVDDGSTDGSDEICERYAAEDSRFRVIHQTNGGLSAARNTGIAEAKADKISFVDSDDWISLDMIATLSDLIDRYDADIAQILMWREFTNGHHISRRIGKEIVLDRLGALTELLYDTKLPSYACGKMFRRNVMVAPFPVGKVFEDIYTVTSWVAAANRVVLSPKPCYHYRQRKGSIMNSNYIRNRTDHAKAWQHRIQILRSLYPDEFSEQRIREFLSKATVDGAKTIARAVPDATERREAVRMASERLRQFPSRPFRLKRLRACSRAALLRNNPDAFAALMRFVYMFDFYSHSQKKHLYD